MSSPEGKPSLTCAAYSIVALMVDRTLGAYFSPDQALGKFLISYSHDTLLPIEIYFAIRTAFYALYEGGFNWKESLGQATAIFAAGSTFELMQQAGLIKGTYDPWDFVAHGVGAGLAVTLDAITFRKIKKP